MIAKRWSRHEVTAYHGSANAVGAAAARPTASSRFERYCFGEIVVPELDYMDRIARPLFFDIKRAREIVVEKAVDYAARLRIPAQREDVEIVEEESYNVVRSFHTAGRIISMKAQVSPGVHKMHHQAGSGG